MTRERKAKPTHVYREEVHNAGVFNATRQTFDVQQYENWRHYAEMVGARDTRFFVGTITWEDA